jgi:hypothetical protein
MLNKEKIMSEFQFCYWLMGVFELGELKTINAKQLVLIREHLNLVEDKKYRFCSWLSGFLFNMEENISLNEKATKLILDNLSNEFLTVIDRSYPKEILNQLYDAHVGIYVQNETPKNVVDKTQKVKKEPRDNGDLEVLC